MADIRVLGLDIAKSVFQLHGVDADGATVLQRRLTRGRMLAFFAKLSLIAFASVLVSGCALSPAPQIQMSPPAEELAGQLYGEIWYDLRSNALIGNGNELAARWANAKTELDDSPQLHIRDLLCNGDARLLRCQFGLLRDGGVALYLGEPAPDRLACTANFHRSSADDRWSIPRLPPGPSGGHSRITIKCQTVN